MSTTRDGIGQKILSARPIGAVGYSLSLSGSVVAKGGLQPFESPPSDLPPGSYRLSFFDAAGLPVCQFDLNYDGNPPASASFTSKVEEAIASVDFDHEARLELDRQKSSSYHRTTIDHYVDWLNVLGLRGKAEVASKAIQQELYDKMLLNYLKLVEAIGERIAQIHTPPQPPQWDKMIGAAAPALAAMYIETVRAIKGHSTPGPSADLLLPSNDKMARVYELLGNVASSERLNTLLQDKEKLQAWMDAVRNFVKDDPNAKSDKPEAKPTAEKTQSE